MLCWLYLQLLQLASCAEDLIGVDLVEVVGGDETGGRSHEEVKGQLLRGSQERRRSTIAARPTAAASGDSQESFGSCCGLLI